MQPEAVEYVLEPYKLYGPEFSFIQDLDCFLSEYDEGFLIPLQLGELQSVTCKRFTTCDTPEGARQAPVCMLHSAFDCSWPLLLLISSLKAHHECSQKR